MSAPVDTSAAAVEAMAARCENAHRIMLSGAFYADAAALLRALLRERDEARQERDAAENAGAVLVLRAERAEAALAAARADALREAAAQAPRIIRDAFDWPAETDPDSACSDTLAEVAAAILALISQEKPHAE